MNKMAKKLRLQEIMLKELCIDAEEKFMPADVECGTKNPDEVRRPV